MFDGVGVTQDVVLAERTIKKGKLSPEAARKNAFAILCFVINDIRELFEVAFPSLTLELVI